MPPSAILASFVGLSVFVLGWTMLLMALNYRESARRGGELPPDAPEGMRPEDAEKASEYSRAKMRFEFAVEPLSAFAVLAIVAMGAFGRLDSILGAAIGSSYWRGAAFFGCLFLLQAIASAPFDLYATFALEKRFGFNTTTIRTWLADRLKGALIGAGIGLPMLALLYLFIDRAGSAWWLWAAAIFTAIEVAISLLYPLLIAPLFNKFTRMPEGSLKTRIDALAEKLSFRFSDVFIMDGSKRSKHSNAYFTGMGKLKRIVLFDTLIAQMNEDEVLAVLAHEIGHEKKRHVLKMTAISVVFGFLAFWALDLCMGWKELYAAFGFASPSRHALILIVSLISGPATFFLTPCFAALSRRFEYEADAFASEATSAAALSSALVKLNVENASNLWPHPLYAAWYYSHPQLRDRLAALKGNGGRRIGST